MEILVYRGVKDIPLSYTRDIYLANSQYVYGPGMYFSTLLGGAVTASLHFEKWGILTHYKLSITKLATVSENSSNDSIVDKFLKLTEQVNSENTKYKGLFKTIYDIDPNYNNLSEKEQDEILKKTLAFNKKVKEENANNEEFQKWINLPKELSKITREMADHLQKEYDALFIEKDNMVIVKNDSVTLEILESRLYGEMPLLLMVSQKYELPLDDGFVIIPGHLIEQVDQDLSSL